MMGTKEPSANRPLPLDGARVLVIEDEYYIADDLRRMLNNAGAVVVGPVPTVRAAHAAVDEGGFDFAVLDLNLHDQSALPIAERLVEQGKSFVIATGYDSGVIPDRLDRIPRLEKPFDAPELLQLLQHLAN